MKKALTIAGFDPSGGAGIQADLKVFHFFGVYGLSAVSSLTAQNTRGVSAVLPVEGKFFKRQLTVLITDLKPEATKTGMLYTETNVAIVAHIIKKYGLKNVVIDPVLLSSTGKRLAEKGVPLALKNKVFPYCTVVTPNIYEASVITGIDIKNKSDMEKAAVCLKNYGPENVIITGGHLEKTAADLFYNGCFHFFESKKINGQYHGTGCAFSAAVTALLAQGKSVYDAARLAKQFMDKLLKKSVGTGGRLELLNI